MANKRSSWRRWIPWAVAGLLLVGLLLLWWLAPDLYDGSGAGPDAQATATATTRAGILAVIAATIAGGAAWASLSETRRANLEAHERELIGHEREREAQVTDRYTKAIGQLGEIGDDRVDVRLGGIYALRRIAEDSPRDLPTVREVLSAFVRGHGRGPVDDGPRPLFDHKPPTDVQAALRAILDIQWSVRIGNGGGGGVDLSAAHLERAWMREAYLPGAELSGIHLSGADLGLADFYDAHAQGADLKWADLEEATLIAINLRHADLRGANLSGADLTGAKLGAADLRCAVLSGADLTEAQLYGADLSDTIGLTQDQVDVAIGDAATTKLPHGLTPPAGWTSPAGFRVDKAPGFRVFPPDAP